MLKKISNLGTSLCKEDQKKVNGGFGDAPAGLAGTTFTCYCGFVGGGGEGTPFVVRASSLIDALQFSGSICNGQGATCAD